jgi:hypothetical protein
MKDVNRKLSKSPRYDTRGLDACQTMEDGGWKIEDSIHGTIGAIFYLLPPGNHHCVTGIIVLLLVIFYNSLVAINKGWGTDE